MKSVSDADVRGKRVIVRADLDMPTEVGEVETFRLERLLPTLRDLISRDGYVRIIAHRGRPEGKADPALSLEEFVPIFAQKLDVEVRFGGSVTENPNSPGSVILYENLRFHPGEEANSPDFVQSLLKLGEIYVNESFATSHRTHASIVSIPRYLPHFAGINLLDEISNLNRIITEPARPLVVVIGGAKVETKRPLVEYMRSFADEILVGGSLSNEGLKPQGKVVLPVDNIDGKDIGPETVERFKKSLSQAKTIVWNGPMGVFEEHDYSQGTVAIAQAVVGSSAYTIVGGGDTIAALDQLGLLSQIKFVSTGGGAMLEFLSGKKLPGLEALE